MKTLHLASKTENPNNIRERLRLGIILTGIVTAIICLLALLYETKSAKNEAGRSLPIGISKIVKTDFSLGVTSRAVIASVWPF